ncbi:MAG TPA: aminopeptidase [Solirubrobacteraceae bacterium]|nr:aminopeptidase [Solirubrobacteraceae bacterium]
MTTTTDVAFDQATLERFADLTIGFAANVQRDQVVAIGAELGKEAMVRALAASAYKHGARFVDVQYFDMHVKRARLLHADEDSLDFVPSWYGQRLLELGRQRCARVGLSGPATPGLLDDLDPRRAGRDQLPFIRESGIVVNERTTNWTIVPYPTVGWARQVHPGVSDEEAMARLSEQILHVCRLDEDDPVAAWRERSDLLVAIAERLTERRFDAVRFDGPGTHLTVGLLPTTKFMAARFETVDGIIHMPNLPSEEVFGAPDPQRTDGVVRATKPLVIAGSIIRGLEIEFRKGKAVRIDAEEGADVLRGYAARDEGASRLGEVALVDGDGRIGRLDTVFFDTLLDENAASHIALGESYQFTAGEEDKERLNHSSIHVDFMIGGDDVAVTGLTEAGAEVPVLREGVWQL